MKNQAFKVLTICLLAVAILMIYQIGNKISYIKCPDGNCRYEVSPNDDEDDLRLTLKLDKEEFTPLHLDLVNDFGILAKAESSNDTITRMIFKLKEVGICEKYDLVGAEYLGTTDIFDKVITDFSDPIRHHIRLTVNSHTSGERNLKIDLEKKFHIKKGDEIDVHFKSDVCTIPITEIESDGPFKIIGVYRPETYFGNNICKAQVTN